MQGNCCPFYIREPDFLPEDSSAAFRTTLEKFPKAEAHYKTGLSALTDSCNISAVSDVAEAVSRMRVVQLALGDLLFAMREERYDFKAVSAVLPGMIFNLNRLEELEHSLEELTCSLSEDAEKLQEDTAESPEDEFSGDLTNNFTFLRIVRFVEESLTEYGTVHVLLTAFDFRNYALTELAKFASGLQAGTFSFTFMGKAYDISCSFDGSCIRLHSEARDNEPDGRESYTDWSLSLGRDGKVGGNPEACDLHLIGAIREGMKLRIDSPDRFHYHERDDEDDR